MNDSFSKAWEHYNMVLGFCSSRMKNLDDAKDITQEVFIKFMNSNFKHDSESNLKGYLMTIAKSIMIDFHRRASVRPQKVTYEGNVHSTIDQHYDFLLESIIEEEVKNLSDRRREVMSLFIDGLKYHEIAEELNIDMPTVKSDIFYSRKLLKEKLETCTTLV